MEEVIQLMSRNDEDIPWKYEDLWKGEGKEVEIKLEQELGRSINW